LIVRVNDYIFKVLGLRGDDNEMLSKKYWTDLKEFVFESPPKYRVLSVVFILLANIAGTTPFPDMLFWDHKDHPYFLNIWTWSLLADVVFIITMSLCFFMTLKVAVNTKSKITYFLSPLLTFVLVPIGYTISWFFVCIGTDLDSGFYGSDLRTEDWSIIEFILPISLEMDLENMGYLMWGFNGFWIPMIFIAVMIFSSVPKPQKDADK